MSFRRRCLSGNVETEDTKLQTESGAVDTSGNSIFLGFGSEPVLEKVEMPAEPLAVSESLSDESTVPTVTTVSVDPGPSLEHLWTFQCDMTKGYNVTSIDWNKNNRVRRAMHLFLLLQVHHLWAILCKFGSKTYPV